MVKSLKVVVCVAGIAMFIASILYVVMAVTAPAITNVEIGDHQHHRSHLPHIDFTRRSPPSLCWLSLRLVGLREDPFAFWRQPDVRNP